VDGSAEAAKILAAMRATGERFGAAHIVDVLLGKTNDRVSALGHHRLSVYGSGRDLDAKIWRLLIRQLVGAGFVSLDIAGFGGLAAAPKGRALLAGTEKFHYRRDMAQTGRRRREDRRKIAESAAPHDDALLQRLKALRWKLARQQGIAAYIIFSDRTLIDMAARKPLTEYDFTSLHGVGEKKLEQFAKIFINEIASFLEPSNSAGNGSGPAGELRPGNRQMSR
jgi:ATP-dependent DNA helicase RecQ